MLYQFDYDSTNRLIQARYTEPDTDPVVFDLVYDGFGRRAILRRNGVDGTRYIYDGVHEVELRRERDDAVIAQYTYAHGTMLKQQRETEERWFTTFAQGGFRGRNSI